MVAPRWFSVTMMFESRIGGIIGVRPLCEERIVLFAAGNQLEAATAATEYGMHAQDEYKNASDESVSWRFVCLSEVRELDAPQAPAGWEVASRFIRRHRRTIDQAAKRHAGDQR